MPGNIIQQKHNTSLIHTVNSVFILMEYLEHYHKRSWNTELEYNEMLYTSQSHPNKHNKYLQKESELFYPNICAHFVLVKQSFEALVTKWVN